MSSCGKNADFFQVTRQPRGCNVMNCNNCTDERLYISNCACTVDFNTQFDPFGPITETDKKNAFMKLFYLKMNNIDKFRFNTRRTHCKTGKTLVRFLNIQKIENNKPLLSASLGAQINYFVEVWHKDNDKKMLVSYPNNSKEPLLRRSLTDMMGDPMQLPRNLGAEFYVKIVAMGLPLTKKNIVPNFRITVECRGYYDLTIETEEFLNNAVTAGTSKVLANGRMD